MRAFEVFSAKDSQHAVALLAQHAATSKVKVLAGGEISRAVIVQAHGFSTAAQEAIVAAGGTVEVLPLPWGDRRPPAKGNQFTNR